MTTNFKLLGLVLVAMVALSAAASIASADEFTAEVGAPVTLTGAQEGLDVFTITAGNTTCKVVKYHGVAETGTTTVRVAPTYPLLASDGKQNCNSLGFLGVIHTNGCEYLFHIEGGLSTAGTVDIDCPDGSEITVTAIANNTTKCTIHVPEQSGLGPVTYTNVGAGPTREVRVEASLSNLKYSHTAGTGLGKCTAGSGTEGKYVGKGLVTSEEIGTSNHVGIFLS